MIISTPEWVKDAVFYQIFPDRFARSARLDHSGLQFEPWELPPTPYGFKGGDLYGVAEKLDYLTDLGVNALYLNPVFASASNHRYHTYDYYQVDPLLGGNDALRYLLEQAHRRGVRVILDGVFNHASRGFWQFHHVLENGDGSPYVNWFHFDPARLQRKRPWGAYPHPEEDAALQSGEDSLTAIGYRAWWHLPALPKFNTNTLAVREFIFGVAEHWIRFGIDGWRLDVPAEIDDDSFWQEFRRRVKALNPDAYIVGEIWHESQRWLQGDQFDAVMNYLVTIAALGFFPGPNLDVEEASRAGGYQGRIRPLRVEEFAAEIKRVLHLYHPEITAAQLNLLDSHDTPRFLTCARGDKESLKLAWLFLFAYPGAPCIYYGDEIGLDGKHDPDCRKTFPWDEKIWDKELLAYIKGLIALRKGHSALRRGDFQQLYAQEDVYAFMRRGLDEKLIVVLNIGSQPLVINIPSTDIGAPLTSVTVLFGMGDIQSASDRLKLGLEARSGMVVRV